MAEGKRERADKSKGEKRRARSASLQEVYHHSESGGTAAGAGTAGGVITDIRPMKRDPNLCTIFVDGKRAATIPASSRETLKIQVDQPWTANIAAEVAALGRRTEARRAALRLLGRKGYSRADLHDRLRKKEFADADVIDVLDELQKQGWLDDNAVAESVAAGAQRSGPAGEALLREKMSRRGVEKGVAERVVQMNVASPDEIREFIRKRLARMTELKPSLRMQRLAGALARRGIDEQEVENVLREFAEEIGVEPNE